MSLPPPPTPDDESENLMETPTWKAMLAAGLISSSIFTGLFYLFLWRLGG